LRLVEAFRSAGLRATPQRYAVLQHLVLGQVHATAEEIFAAVNRNDPRASRATVYNNLRSLMRVGLVCEVPSDGKAARFDARLTRHHHFVCDRCGGVEDVAWFELPENAGWQALAGRRVRSYELVFHGNCGACQKLENLS
jgi:Fur family transcriptional regulator, peroxide stress response regulator